MEALQTVKVHVVVDLTPNSIPCSSSFTAEELCILLCNKYDIPPLTRTLFALRVKGSEFYLKDNYNVLLGTREYELRIRFKVPKFDHLITLDEKTYDYYFQQARNDVFLNKIPEITYPEHKNELFGLGLTDMYRAILEENVTMNEVKKNCKKHIPKLIMKRHGLFAKKHVHQTLPVICARSLDCCYVKGTYLQQLHILAPNYLSEEFKNIIWKQGKESVNVHLHVAPFHLKEPGIRLYNVNEAKWSLMCTIEDLVYVTRNLDNSVEISRRGTPLFFKFPSEEQLSSFISVCDGYYRLMIKWTFNLSKDDETPSLKELQRMKCHGPVGGAFSYRKLEEKRAKKHGCYILRQCQDEYNMYYLDVCTKSNTTETYKLEFKGNCYMFNNEEYFSIERLVSSHQNPEGRIFLDECIPPSEYDKSQLLLCGEPQKLGVRIDQAELQDILRDNKSPRCLSPKDILLYSGVLGITKPVYMNEIDAFGDADSNLTFVYYSVSGVNAMWEFPFCDDDNVCEEHTTFYPHPVLLWPLRRVHMNYELEVSVRTYHSAIVYFTLDPYHDYPRIVTKIGFNDIIEVTFELSTNALPLILGKVERNDLINYWKRTELHFSLYAQELQIIWNDEGHFKTVLKARHDVIGSMAWFSVGANYSVAHWTFYCDPPAVPPAYPPDCALTPKEFGYNGSESVTSSESRKTGSGGITATTKALWKLDQTRKLEVAYMTLGDNMSDYLKDFIELASKWACVQSSSIVRLYGITLNSPTAMVLEYLPYGPFDDYLRKKGKHVTTLHLKKVAASLARALWDLSEAGIVHGYIRCRRLLVASADSQRVVVKLSGPSLYQYTAEDVHWMPVELMPNMSLARRSVTADIWAFATTLWEIFSYGQKPTDTNPVRTAKSYEMGERLMRPENCPAEVWSLVKLSWQHDPHARPRPQELMRDLNHMLHAEYIPEHIYEEPKISLDTMDHEDTVSSDRFIPSEISDVGSNKSLISVDSSLPSMNGTTLSDNYYHNMLSGKLSGSLDICTWTWGPPESGPAPALPGRAPSPEDPLHAPRQMTSVMSNGTSYLVTLCGRRLGEGNYGHVFKGWMERDNHKQTQKREVAVKILSHDPEGDDNLLHDFKNELEIMKSLQHSNIIEILGYSIDECGQDVRIYMEYMEEGSLNNYLKFQGHKLRISHLLKYCLDIASGMDHISAKNIIHRDLATRNILVVNRHHVKITDFGLARAVPKNEDSYKLRSNKQALPIDWSAPEAAMSPFQFSSKSDVWSYGVTVWEIFTRANSPVPSFDRQRPNERAACFQIPNECPSEVFRYLMKDCWELLPAKRPSFIDLVHKCKGIIADYK